MQIIRYFKLVKKFGILSIIYRYHYKKTGRELPRTLGLAFNFGNKITNRIRYRNDMAIDIYTYDGSDQVVHPDVDVLSDGRAILVCTPYPYNTEVYENPCLYVFPAALLSGNIAGARAKEPVKIPIDKRHGRKRGEHMSDPAVIIYDEKIHLFYRDCEFIAGKPMDFLYEKVYSAEDYSLIGDSLVSKSDKICVSPTFIENGIELKNFSVLYSDNDSQIVFSTKKLFDANAQWSEYTVSEIAQGEILQDYYVWHISISYKFNRSKHSQGENNDLIGIFTMRYRANNDLYKLFAAVCCDGKWVITNEIPLPANFRRNGFTPYKSCILQNSSLIIVSAYDRKKRWKLLYLKVEDTMFEYEEN